MDNPINLNTAQEDELTLLPGIGKAMAGRVVDSRPFSHLDDLLDVTGISPAFLERLKPLVVIEEETKEVDGEQLSVDISETEEIPPELTEDILESETEQNLGESEALSEEIIPREKALVPLEGQGGEKDDNNNKSKSVTWGQMLLVAAISSFSACFLAVLFCLGIIGSINGGLDFATSNQVQSVQRQVEAMEINITTLNDDLEGLRTRVDNFDTMSSRIGDLESNLESLSQEFDGILEDFNGISGEVSEINQKVDRFQTFLDGLADLLENLIGQP